jgi:hypothetical protein
MTSQKYRCWIDLDWNVEDNRPHFETEDEETMRSHLFNHKRTELVHELLSYMDGTNPE